MMRRGAGVVVGFIGWLSPTAVLAQERMHEWGWGMHSMWGIWGIAMAAMMLLFWGVIILAIVLTFRWLMVHGREPRTDAALEILRQRYARGEIDQEEFESKRRNLTRA